MVGLRLPPAGISNLRRIAFRSVSISARLPRSEADAVSEIVSTMISRRGQMWATGDAGIPSVISRDIRSDRLCSNFGYSYLESVAFYLQTTADDTTPCVFSLFHTLLMRSHLQCVSQLVSLIGIYFKFFAPPIFNLEGERERIKDALT